MSNRLSLLLLIVVLLTSCKKEILTTDEDAVAIEDFKIDEIEFEYLSLRSKLDYTDEKSNLKATANIRIKKDSLIWLSVTPGLGIEAARGIITKDSLVIVDRINKQYSIFKFEELSKKFKFELDYDLLEALLLGNAPKKISNEDKVRLEGSVFKLSQQRNSVSILNYIDNSLLKVERISMEDALTDNSMIISYSDFQQVDEYIFPFQSIISLSYKQQSGSSQLNTQIKLEHNKTVIESKSLKFPFNIPSKYERK